MFESASAGGDGYKPLGDGKLPTGDDGRDKVTKEEFAKMGYKSRVELKGKTIRNYIPDLQIKQKGMNEYGRFIKDYNTCERRRI